MHASPHVLVAEDEDLLAEIVAETLESQGFRVTLVHNGLEAVEADAVDPADILLTDMRMPKMGGETLIQIIRLRRPDLPIIVTTGYSEHLPNEEPGRLVVLRKPYSLSVLAPVITALLSGRMG
ncbi:response regulator (plasmid) [Azospirillum sp. TSA2s]|uniref:response regulator n=1 Tax=Azospirillum sp. TSA2s TaxID=709810 RepID=UPI0010AACB11|nr:response regulator [Azospirillum sp. TSA2s]QCG92882.1 response regulator [Azospirillum sp. TSA2s]QCG99341.1 response regulator [Azospirillum sp. TSA2s]